MELLEAIARHGGSLLNHDLFYIVVNNREVGRVYKQSSNIHHSLSVFRTQAECFRSAFQTNVWFLERTGIFSLES